MKDAGDSIRMRDTDTLLITVDTEDRETAVIAKMEAHRGGIGGILHRVFSIFVFDEAVHRRQRAALVTADRARDAKHARALPRASSFVGTGALPGRLDDDRTTARHERQRLASRRPALAGRRGLGPLPQRDFPGRRPALHAGRRPGGGLRLGRPDGAVASSSADRETTDASRIRRRYQASVNAHQVLAHIVLEIPPQTGAAKTP